MAKKIPEWEYLVTYLDLRDNNLTAFYPDGTTTYVSGADRFTWLDAQGDAGWEFFAICTPWGQPGLRAYFKRCTKHCPEYFPSGGNTKELEEKLDLMIASNAAIVVLLTDILEALTP